MYSVHTNRFSSFDFTSILFLRLRALKAVDDVLPLGLDINRPLAGLGGLGAGRCSGCGAVAGAAPPPQAVSTRLAITRIAAHIQIVLTHFQHVSPP